MYFAGNGPRFMAGTPALLLVECMMSQQLLPMIRSNTRYVSLLKYLVRFGIDHCNTLDFIQAVLKKMESLKDNVEEICLLWNTVASACIKYLKSGGQVNQGSDHQHDFTCFYAMLMFPLHHVCNIPHSEACEVVLVWHDLYKLFYGVASSSVTTLDTAEIQETLASKLNQILVKNSPKTAKQVIAILKVTQDIVKSVPFSEVFGQQSQSKRRGRALSMFSLVVKISQLLTTFERVEEFFNTSWATLAIIIDVVFKNMKQTNSMPVALQLSDPISAVLQVQVVPDGSSKFCSDCILKMWKDYLRFVDASLSKKSLKDAISWLFSLLEFGFKSGLLEVRTATLEFWDNCLYPMCHKEGVLISKELQELREKCGSTVARHSIIVADSEDDNASDIQHEGKANKENICNSETVVKQMNDAVFAIPEPVVKGKGKSLVQQLKDDGHVLTRHQKEILRSKKDDIPVLYSSTLQPEQDSQYSQNSEGSQDTLEFTGPSRILEPVVEEALPTPGHSLKVLEPPSAQRRLAEYRKKMMIDDEGSIILTTVSTAKEPVSDLAVPVSSGTKSHDEAGQDIEAPNAELLASENRNTLNNRKLNLESVAVPMLGSVIASNSSVSIPEVRLSISNSPAQTSATTDSTESGCYPLEEAPVENNVELDSESNLLVAANTLQHLEKDANRDTVPENAVLNAPLLLQNYVDFPPVEYVNTSAIAVPETDMTCGSITELNMSAEQNSRSIPDEKEKKSSGNYFKAVSIALVDDDEEEEDDNNEELLNVSAGSEMSIQKTNLEIQSDVDAVKVVVEKVEDFSLNKTFAALETIAASTFVSTELEHISPQASNICCPNRENSRRSSNKLKGKSVTKDPVELGLLKLFAQESQNSGDSLKDDGTDEQKSSQQEDQKSAQHNPRSRSGRGRPRKNSKSTSHTSPSLITGSKSKLKQGGKLTADKSKTNKFAHNRVNSSDKDQYRKEEISKETTSALEHLEAALESEADNSLLYSLSDNLFEPNVVPVECEGLIKDSDIINNKSDGVAKSNISRNDSKDLKPSNEKKALLSIDKEKEKSSLEKGKRKRNSNSINENAEQKAKRPRRSKLSTKMVSISEPEVSLINKDITDKAAGREYPLLCSVSKDNPGNAVKDCHPVMHSNSVINNEKHSFKEISTFEIGKSIFSNTTVAVFGALKAGEEHKLEKIPKALNTSNAEKNSLLHTDNGNSSDLMAKGGDQSLEDKHIQATNPNINPKNDSSLEPKSKLSKKGGLVETTKKKDKRGSIPLRKLRSTAKGNMPCGISVSLRVDETVKVSENMTVETESKSPRSQSVSSMENKDGYSQISSVHKSKSNKLPKNETEIGNTLTKKEEQEPSESQDVVESSQSNPLPSIFSWNNLKTCSVVVKKLDTNLEPGSKVNLDENLVLIKTPDQLSPYKVCTQELDSTAHVNTTADDRLGNIIEKARKNFQNVDVFANVKLNSGSSEVEAVKSVPKAVTDLNSPGTSKEKSEGFVKKRSSSAGNKSKSPVSSNNELSASETNKIKKISSTKEIPQTKPKKAYVQTLITESISNVHERKEKHNLSSSSREGVKTRHQKVISHPSPKEEAQSKEKACPLGEETNKGKLQTSKLLIDETNDTKSQASKLFTEETNKTKPQTSKSLAEETSKDKIQISKVVTEESRKAKSDTSKSLTEETNKTKPQTSKSLAEETSKGKIQTSKVVTEESRKAKSDTSKSLTEETNKTKPQTSKSLAEETSKGKFQTSKSLAEGTSKDKFQTSKLLTEETNETKSKPLTEVNKTKSQISKSLTEEKNKVKPQTSKSHTEAAQAKSDATENVEKDNCEEQGTNAHVCSVPESQTEIHSSTKEAAVIQSCNTKSVPEVANSNSVHRETIKPQPGISEPSSSDSKLKSFVVEAAAVKGKLSSAEVEMSSSEKIHTQTTKTDALPIVSETGSEELNSKAQKTKSSLITDFGSVKERDDDGSTAVGKRGGHIQTEGVEVQLRDMLKESEPEKTDLKSKFRKARLCASTSETASVGIKENVQSFISVDEIVKSKADKSRSKLQENKLLNEELVKSKRNQKQMVVNGKDNFEKPTELVTSDDTNLLNIETSQMSSCNKTSEESLPSDGSDKSGETKEKSVQTAKVKKNSSSLSNIKSCLLNDKSEAPNLDSTSLSENESNTVLQPISIKELDQPETSSKSDKVDEASTCNTNKEDTVKDKALQHLFGGEESIPKDAESQVATDQEAPITTESPSSPQVEKATNMQHTKKESVSKTGKRRGRPPKLNIKKLFPVSRKRSITKESPGKSSKNGSRATSKSPKKRKLFSTEGQVNLIITSSDLQSPKSKPADTTEALSTPTSSESLSLPLPSPENTSPSAPSSMENSSVFVSTSTENPTPAVEISAMDCGTSASNQASPSIPSSFPSTSAASCPLSDVASSETSPPKTSMPKNLSPKLSSPKSLLNSPSSLLKAFSSSPSNSELKQSRIGHHASLAGRAQFMVGLALVSKEGKSASESSAKHDSTSSGTKTLFSSSPTEGTSAVESPAERNITEVMSTPVKRRSLLMDPKRRLNSKKKRVSFSETPQTIVFECHINEKKRIPSKSRKAASIKSSEEPSAKKAKVNLQTDQDNSDDDVVILTTVPDSEAAVSSGTTVKEADSPDLSGIVSQGSLQEVRTELLNSQQPIFPVLVNCNHPVEAVVAQLTSHPMWTKAFLNEMYQRNIRTIGDLSKCDEVTINRLPIPVPKVAHTIRVLQDYQKTLSLLPRRGFWHTVGSRLVEQEAPSASLAPSASPAPSTLPSSSANENLLQCLNVSDFAKFIANNPKSLHAILEEAVKIPHAQEKVKKEIQSANEELVGTANVVGTEQLERMVEYVLSHQEQFLPKIPLMDLYKFLTTRSPEETEKLILECFCTYLRAGSFNFLEKLSASDNSVDLLNIIQSYMMMKKPIVEILEGLPQDSVLHFATSKLTLADKVVMCSESLVTDNNPSPALLEKLVNSIIAKLKVSGALEMISQVVLEKLKSLDL